MSVFWRGILAIEGERTGDGRVINAGALRWSDDLANNPLPLMAVFKASGGHDNAVPVGVITRIERDGSFIRGEGMLDDAGENGSEAIRLIQAKMLDGVSVDLDDLTVEYLRGEPDLEIEDSASVKTSSRAALTAAGADDAGKDMELPPVEGDKIVISSTDPETLSEVTDARIRAATLVSIPAFASARIQVVSTTSDTAPDDGVGVAADSPSQVLAATHQTLPTPAPNPSLAATNDGPRAVVTSDPADKILADLMRRAVTPSTQSEAPAAPLDDIEALTAAAPPLEPPRAWFDDPGFSEPSALVITRKGRVYGHAAVWNTCHTGFAGECVIAPHSPSNYAHFKRGSVITAEGDVISTGRITFGTGHANEHATPREALAHYDNTGMAGADVNVGEDAFGIWVAGALLPTIDPVQTRVLRGSPLSGDWRYIDGSLELFALLSVNAPGFPVPRPRVALRASGAIGDPASQQNMRVTSLVAAGMLSPTQIIAPGHPGALSAADIRYLQGLLQSARVMEAQNLRAHMLKIQIENAAKTLGLASTATV